MPNNLTNQLALVVDDCPESLSLIHDVLEAEGMDVLVALEGKQALSIARRMKPDVIFLDAVMPILNGFETCEAIKKDASLAQIPVIFMTGLSDSEHVVKGLQAGGVDYLTKPIQPTELIARLQVHLLNAHQKRSAYSALDRSGHVTMAVNRRGEELWATPNAYTLLGKAGFQSKDGQTYLQATLNQWLNHQPDVGYFCALKNQHYELTAKLISIEGDEFELLLIDGQQPSGAELLKDRLNLTERESEVLYWISNGKTNREVANILDMSPRTVNKHLEQIFTKLDVDNRTRAAGTALKTLALENALA